MAERSFPGKRREGARGRYAVIEVPDFALQAALRLEPMAGEAGRGTAEPTAALLSEKGKETVVFQVTPTAHRAGVEPGMSASQAMARCPDILLLHRRESAETFARRALLDYAFSFSPRVEETAEGLCTVDLRGNAQHPVLHPGKHGTGARHSTPRSKQETRNATPVASENPDAPAGFRIKIGVAGSPLLARYAARLADPILVVEEDGGRFLKDLPLELADPGPETAEVLANWGIATLGELTALPRQEVVLRLGSEGAALWDRAAGREERPLRVTTLPAEFVEQFELEDGVETLEPLLFLLRRMIEQLCLRLRTAGKAAGEVKLELGMRDCPEPYRRDFRVPEPSAENEMIFRMLHSHLESVRTEAAITEIALRFEPVSPVVRQRELFGNGVKDPARFSETLAQLSALVGSGRVGRPAIEETNRPDAFSMKKLNTDPEWLVEEESPLPATGPVLRRFRPPFPARVECRGTHPFWFLSDRAAGRIIACRGPWKESGGWWESGLRWEREEWDVELSGGGLYRLVRNPDGWVLEGMYD